MLLVSGKKELGNTFLHTNDFKILHIRSVTMRIHLLVELRIQYQQCLCAWGHPHLWCWDSTVAFCYSLRTGSMWEDPSVVVSGINQVWTWQELWRKENTDLLLREEPRQPTFLFKMGAVLLVDFHHLVGQTLPRMNGRKKQFIFLIVALDCLQYLDGKRGTEIHINRRKSKESSKKDVNKKRRSGGSWDETRNTLYK